MSEMQRWNPAIADLQRMVILENTHATGAANAVALKDDLKENSPFKTPVVRSSLKNPADTLEMLGETMEDGDLLYLLTGDGTANTVAQLAGAAGAPKFATMFGPLGNARNNYKATIAADLRGQAPSKILAQAAIESILPLRARVEGDDTYTRLALSIISVGAIATGAAVLEEPKHRNSWLRRNEHTRYPYEIFLSLFKTLPQTRTLEVSDVDGSHVRPQLDIFAAHAPEIGKAASFDASMTAEDFLIGTMKNRAPWNMGLGMLQLMRGTFPVEQHRAGDAPVKFQLTDSKKNRRAMIQFDGEPLVLALSSIVSIDQPDYHDATHRPIAAITAGTAQAA